ncbi:hypothetical protein AQ619_01175 [Caulobacter henricii]|uniref:Uncharacterized protein n=2 Tax=Caulobacter henricii TaxID=69395 RepID=A0A0P0P3N6_9CAUL|nr:hypothetical protein AQ619_01175 [Caulobacter henricii]
MLDDITAWPKGTGLYCLMQTGHTFENHLRFQLYPLTNESREISGIGVNILGLQFLLLLEPPDLAKSPDLVGAKFRPSEILIQYPSVTNRIMLSWSDGRLHQDKLTAKFVKVLDAG